MQRELVDILYEALDDLPGLPETFMCALVEGAHALTGGTKSYRPFTADELEAAIAYLKGNSARSGVPFDETFYRKDIPRHPGRYQNVLLNLRQRKEMPTRTELAAQDNQAADRKKEVAASKNARFRYYAALVPLLKKSFSYYNIPFNTTRAMEEVAGDDRRWIDRLIVHGAQESPAFVSLGAAMKDPVSGLLRRKNPSLAKFIDDAFSFRNMDERGLERKKEEYRYMRTDVSGEQLNMSDGDPDTISKTATREIDNKIAQWYGPEVSFGTVLSRCKGIPYEQVYRYFKEHGGDNRIKNVPMPGEGLVAYLGRMPRGTGSEIEFTTELNRIAEAAYGKPAVDAAVNEVKSRNPQAFAEMSAKCSRSMVKPKDIPLYTAWSLIHSK